MDQSDMQRLAKMCGATLVFDASGGPTRADNLDLIKFCAALNAYVRLDILRDIQDLGANPELVAEIRKGSAL